MGDGRPALPSLHEEDPDTVEQDVTGHTTIGVLASRSLRPWLIVVASQNSTGRMFPLGDQDIVIGNSSEADLVLKEEGVSRRHVKVHMMPGGAVRISDLDSTRGVTVDG